MKKLSQKRKLYLDRRARRLSLPHGKTRHTGKTRPAPWTRVWLPEEIRLIPQAQRTQLLDSVTLLRQYVAMEQKNTVVDFSRTRRVFSDGMLLLYAEIRRLRTHFPSVRINCQLPRSSNKVAEVLKQIGLLDFLGCQNHIVPSEKDVVHWHFATGVTVDGEKYESLVGKPFEGALAPPLHEALYVGMTEAMTNVIHHAYGGKRDDGLELNESSKRWWMFSTARDGHLSVVLCDLGVGIPETFPYTHPSVWRYLRTLGRTKDHNVIEEAVKLGATRTAQPGRGRGLPQLLDIVTTSPGSRLIIHSNHGAYFRNGEHTTTYDYRDSILGTLINWRIPLTK